jgi:hypothetical protein
MRHPVAVPFVTAYVGVTPGCPPAKNSVMELPTCPWEASTVNAGEGIWFATTTVYACVYVAGVVESVTVTVKLELPSVVGVPVIVSVVESVAAVNVRPAGSVPAETDHEPAVATVNVSL